MEDTSHTLSLLGVGLGAFEPTMWSSRNWVKIIVNCPPWWDKHGEMSVF